MWILENEKLDLFSKILYSVIYYFKMMSFCVFPMLAFSIPYPPVFLKELWYENFLLQIKKINGYLYNQGFLLKKQFWTRHAEVFDHVLHLENADEAFPKLDWWIFCEKSLDENEYQFWSHQWDFCIK